MTYLVDTSALVRIVRKQTSPAWYDFAEKGLLAVCEPVVAETMLIASTKEYAAIEDYVAKLCIPVSAPERMWKMSAAIRRALVPHGAHRGLSGVDLEVVAAAVLLKLTVLHEDADFETAARFVPAVRERRISPGPGRLSGAGQ